MCINLIWYASASLSHTHKQHTHEHACCWLVCPCDALVAQCTISQLRKEKTHSIKYINEHLGWETIFFSSVFVFVVARQLHLTRLSSCLPCDVWLHSSLFSCYFSLSRVTASSTSSSRCQMSVCVRYVGCLFVSMDLRLAVIISIVYICISTMSNASLCAPKRYAMCIFNGHGKQIGFSLFTSHAIFFLFAVNWLGAVLFCFRRLCATANCDDTNRVNRGLLFNLLISFGCYCSMSATSQDHILLLSM